MSGTRDRSRHDSRTDWCRDVQDRSREPLFGGLRNVHSRGERGPEARCPPRDPRVSGRPRRVRYGISRVSELLGHMPMPVFTFLERFDFSGKTIRPFCTQVGSGMGCSVSNIKRICPDAIVEQGLALVESSVRESEGVVARWLGHRVFPQLYPCIPPSER